MKTLLTLFLALMLTTAHAQEPDKGLVKVIYNFIHIQDTTKRDKPYTENMLLIAGKNASLYSSYDKIDQAVDELIKGPLMRKNGFTNDEINAQAKPYRPTSATEYYFFTKEHKFFSVELLEDRFMVEDDIDKIDWKIARDTLNFSGIHCQKATAAYKGRKWIAWFATELPFASGPWKLQGLPGLIIEAYDDEKEVQFKFGGIKKIEPGDMATENAKGLPPGIRGTRLAALYIDEIKLHEKPFNNGGPSRITKKDFDKQKIEHDKDPDAYRIALFTAMGMKDPIGTAAKAKVGSGGGGSIGGSGGSITGNPQTATIKTNTPAPPPPPQNVINNPIELPEKK